MGAIRRRLLYPLSYGRAVEMDFAQFQCYDSNFPRGMSSGYPTWLSILAGDFVVAGAR